MTEFERKKDVEIVRVEMIKEKNVQFTVNQIMCPKDASIIAKEFLENCDREYLIVMSLDTKNKVNNISVVSVGSLNSSIVHPREVFKTIILSNSASFIIAHNHPSGNVEPSKEDIKITERLKECGQIMGIELLDHIIIGDESYISLKEKGFI